MAVSKSKKYVLGAALLLTGFSASSQSQSSAWSLEKCLDQALENNLQIKQSQNNVQLNQADLRLAKGNRLPSLNGSASGGINYGSSIDPLTSEFRTEQIRSANFSLTSGVTLFAGRQITNQIKQRQAELDAGYLDVEQVKNDVMLNVITAYLNILFAEELLQTAQLQLQNTQQQLERTEKLFRAGSVAENSVLDIQAQVATEELNIINAENQIAQAELQLINLLNLDTTTDQLEIVRPEIPEPDEQPEIAEPALIFETAKQVMPQIKSSETRVTSAAIGLTAAKGAYYPRLSLSGSIFTGYSSARSLFQQGTTLVPQALGFSDDTGSQPLIIYRPETVAATYAFGEQFNDNLGRSINLNLSIPILNGWQTRTNVQRARIGLRNAELNVEIAKNQLRQEIQQAYADAMAARRKYIAATNQAVALERSFQNATARFNAGILNSTDYNLAANNFRRAQSDVTQAKYDYLFKLKILDFYQGKPLSF